MIEDDYPANKMTCGHMGGIRYGYFTLRGIERKGIYCKNCNELLDYIPQYNED